MSASPESFSARIVERKYVLILQIQLNDRSGIAVDTGIVKINVRIKFTKKSFNPVLGLQSGTLLHERITLHLFSLFSFIKSLLNGAAAMNQRY